MITYLTHPDITFELKKPHIFDRLLISTGSAKFDFVLCKDELEQLENNCRKLLQTIEEWRNKNEL